MIPFTSQQAWIISTVWLYSCDHWIGGSISLCIALYYTYRLGNVA